jgi:2-polyprenyl-3-methyl-5-hydroxy-6-metoxy-1,4-benzoquinol methylase
MAASADIRFSSVKGREILLACTSGTFRPTGTTKLLIQAVQQTLPLKPVSLLDLGCGTGVVGIALHMLGLVNPPVFASDLSDAAVECSRGNFERYACRAEVRRGSMFEPWANRKFDVVVNDISGVAQEVAAVSPWFDGVPCASGKDGTALVADIIRQAPAQLTAGGKFFFPVISLSNVGVLLEQATGHFRTVERVARQDWPLPPELKAHLALLEKLQSEGHVKLHQRFGMTLWYTEVYCAFND